MRAHWRGVITDEDGNALPGASVSVVEPNTETLISETLYTTDDSVGNVEADNPLTANSSGEVHIWLDDAKRVDLIVSNPPFPERTIPSIDVLSTTAPPAAVRLPGEIVAYGGAVAPAGWLLCNGAEVSRATYAGLFAIIGEAFGPGDGATTFDLPDLRQRFPLGKAAAGTGNTLGATGGAIDHTHSTPNHQHSVNPPDTVTSQESDTSIVGAGGAESVANNNHTHSVNIAAFLSENDGAGTSGTNNPPFQVVNYIIKT